jgi:predicted dinucleotide-binding enzyme
MINKPAIGVIGAGRFGTAIARQALAAGYTVRITNSRGPDTLQLQLSILLPGAQAVSLTEVIAKSDLIILAIPLNQYQTLPQGSLSGKIVVDAMNYWPPTEGYIPEFSQESVGSSEYLQQYFTDARIVKTLNHVAYNELEEHSLPINHPSRRAIAVAGNDADAKAQVTQFITALGFDAIDLGALSQGRLFQPDTNLFNARLTKREIEQITAPTR